MTESQKITAWWLAGMAVCGFIAFIRWHVLPQSTKSTPAISNVYSSRPECAAIDKQMEDAAVSEDDTDQDDTKTFLRQYDEIEKSNLSSDEKEDRIQRLIESDDISDVKKEASSNRRFWASMRQWEALGCGKGAKSIDLDSY
jgi:hypothetical protein